VWLATGGGIGFIRWAPGTFGTLLGLPLAWALALLPLWGRVPAILGVIALGIPICGAAARRLGRKDPGAVVWDEIAAVPVTFVLTSFDRSPGSLAAVMGLGFVLFRVFDILKPPPAPRLERLPGGWGIMADDLAAAVYAGLCLHGLMWLVGI
jgi:phosphatidylglycerophosphatase A